MVTMVTVRGVFDILPGQRIGAGGHGKLAIFPIDLAHYLVLLHSVDQKFKIVEGKRGIGRRRSHIRIDLPPETDGARANDRGLDPTSRIWHIAITASGRGHAIVADIIRAEPRIIRGRLPN